MRAAVCVVTLLGGLAGAVDSSRQQVMAAVLPASLSLKNAHMGGSSVISQPLGVGSGEIADERISASSVYRAPKSLFNPWLGRANARPSVASAGGWRAGKDATGEYLQIDLQREFELTAVATQGQAYSDSWVTSYRLQHSRDGVAWRQYPGELAGNSDSDTVTVHDLHERVLARYVRLVVRAWHGHVALRAEVYGFSPECAASEEERVVGVPCAKSATAVAAARYGEGEGEANVVRAAPERPYSKGFPLGLEAGLVPDGGFTASSTHVSAAFVAGDRPDCAPLHAAIRKRDAKHAAAAAAAALAKKSGHRPAAPAAVVASVAPVAAVAAPPARVRSPRFMQVDAELGVEAEVAVGDAAEDGAAAQEVLAPPPAPLERDEEAEGGESAAQPQQQHRFAAAAAEADAAAAAVNAAAAEAASRGGAASKQDGSSALPPPPGKADCGIRLSHAAHYGRLNELPQPYRSGGWRPASDRLNEWLKVDLGSLQEVDAVATQGRANSRQWVTAFTLDYSSNGRQWETLPVLFTANSDANTAVKNVLPRPLLTRYLRFNARDWNREAAPKGGKAGEIPAAVGGGGIGLRVEVFGPGKGAGCMLRCFAAKLARGENGDALEAQLGVANNGGQEPALLLEVGAGTSAAITSLAELAVAADASAGRLVSCCGCPCCEAVDPGACRAAVGKGGRRGGGGRRKVKRAAASGGAKAGGGGVDAATGAALADTVRILLRGTGREGAAFASPNARNVAEAVDKTVAAAVTIPQSGKTFYVVQKAE